MLIWKLLPSFARSSYIYSVSKQLYTEHQKTRLHRPGSRMDFLKLLGDLLVFWKSLKDGVTWRASVVFPLGGTIPVDVYPLCPDAQMAFTWKENQNYCIIIEKI